MKTTVKQCEWINLDGTQCREAGYVFYRDHSGEGHWLCPAHRDEWKQGDQTKALISQAAEAIEVFGEDELERYAAEEQDLGSMSEWR